MTLNEQRLLGSLLTASGLGYNFATSSYPKYVGPGLYDFDFGQKQSLLNAIGSGIVGGAGLNVLANSLHPTAKETSELTDILTTMAIGGGIGGAANGLINYLLV